MSRVYFISDLHIGHKNILKFSPERMGDSVEEHDFLLIECINQVVGKKDVLWLLGDVCFDITKMPLFERLHCRTRLILGNHDKFDASVYLKYFDKISGPVSYKGFWLSHHPIHPEELRGKPNIHGHVHSKTLNDPRYFNVCVENVMCPIELTKIRERTAI